MKEEITVIIDHLADKLQVPIVYLWDALLTQAMISGISDLLFYASIAGVCWGSFKLIAKYSREDRDGNVVIGDDDKRALIGITVVVSVILALVSLLNLPDTLGALFNPAYWALSQLIN